MANSNFATDLITMTYDKYARKDLIDNIFTSNALLFALQQRGNYVPYDGGTKILEPVMGVENTGAKAFSDYELLNTSATEIATNAEFAPRNYSVNVTISGAELDANSGETAQINMLKARMDNAKQTLQGLMNAHLYNDSVGGSDGKQLDGIGIMVDSAGTYGNIDPTSDTWWAATESAYSSALVDELTTIYLSVSKGSTDKPDLGVTTQTVYESLLQEVDPVLQLSDTTLGNVGFESFKFRGMDVVYDEDCTSGVFYCLNSKYIKLHYHTNSNFRMRPAQSPVNQDADISQIIWRGALTCGARLRNGKLTGIS